MVTSKTVLLKPFCQHVPEYTGKPSVSGSKDMVMDLLRLYKAEFSA